VFQLGSRKRAFKALKLMKKGHSYIWCGLKRDTLHDFKKSEIDIIIIFISFHFFLNSFFGFPHFVFLYDFVVLDKKYMVRNVKKYEMKKSEKWTQKEMRRNEMTNAWLGFNWTVLYAILTLLVECCFWCNYYTIIGYKL